MASTRSAVVDTATGPFSRGTISGAADIVVNLPRRRTDDSYHHHQDHPEKEEEDVVDSEDAHPHHHESTTTTTTNTFKLAFGSCHKNKYADAQIWKTIGRETADAFLWTGDAVYPPVRDIASLELLQQEYQRTRTDPRIGYRDFLRVAGRQQQDQHKFIFGTWDDHDYGGNDRGNDMPQKKERAALFYQFLGLQNEPFVVNGDREGVYYSVEWRQSSSNSSDSSSSSNRRVKAIFLDTRWFRQPHCIPSVAGRFPLGAGIACFVRWLSAGLLPNYCTRKAPPHAILGAAQWEWLEAQILHDNDRTQGDQDKPRVLIVISSIQVLSTNPVMESWGHFPAECNRLVELLLRAQQRRNTHVVLLSGDVHHAELLDPLASSSSSSSSTSAKTAFVEVTSSGLTHDCSAHIYGALCRPLLEMYHRHRYQHRNNYYIGRNYGTINIDWDKETVEVAIHEVMNGTRVLTTGSRPLRWNDGASILPEIAAKEVFPCMDGHLIPVAWTVFWTLVLMIVGGRSLLLIGRRRGRRQAKKEAD